MPLPLAGAKIKAADLLAIFPGGVDAAASYIPVWRSSGTQPVLGNGSVTGAYYKIGRLVYYAATLSIGSTSTFGTGSYTLSLPFVPSNISVPLGHATIIDASGGVRFNRYMIATGGTGGLDVTAQTEAGVGASTAVPMTWATGDTWCAAGMYVATS